MTPRLKQACLITALATPVLLLATAGYAHLPAPMIAEANPPAKAAPATPAAGQDATDPTSETYSDLDFFTQALETIRANYVDAPDERKLIDAAVNGMLTSLDPHSNYMNQKQYGEMESEITGEFGGIGAEVTMEKGLIKIVSPLDGEAAAKAGLQPGDYIVEIDGKAIDGLDLMGAVDKLRGPIGTSVKLLIERKGKPQPFEVTLFRQEVIVQAVKSHLDGGDIGYIRISSFSSQADSGLRTAVAALKKEADGKLAGIVLDLRNDPGGLLNQAVAVAGDLIGTGDIVSIKGRHPQDDHDFRVSTPDITGGLPIAVLINSGSASASEIVAGALKDDHRAVIMGTRSFGKGSVQNIIPFPGRGAMRMTIARYYTPSGRSIQDLGIIPDIVVLPARVEEFKGIQGLHESDLPGALKNTDPGAQKSAAAAKDAAKPDAAKETGTPNFANKAGADAGTKSGAAPQPIEFGSPQDYQFARAADLLRGASFFQAHERR